MKFQKGNTAGGRTAGSKNKTTQKIREAYQQLIEDNLPQLQDDIDALKPAERLRFLIDLSNYVIPKLRNTEQTVIDRQEKMQPIQINFKD